MTPRVKQDAPVDLFAGPGDTDPLETARKGRAAVPIPDSAIEAVKSAQGTPKKLPVTPGTFVGMDRMLRRAAALLDVSLAIRYHDANGDLVSPDFKTPEKSTAVLMKFQAGEKVTRTRSKPHKPRAPKPPVKRENQSDASFKADLMAHEVELGAWQNRLAEWYAVNG